MNWLHLGASYGSFSLDVEASWSARSVALFGASGSGKSTVLESIAGLRPEVRGTVELDGVRLDGLPARRRGVGWVPQDASLFPHLSVRRNIEYAIDVGRRTAATQGVRGGGTAEAVAALELAPLLDRPARDLSGGERQRVAIARALAASPRLLLLDEPLASIDRPLRARLLPYLVDLPERTGVPLFLVTHDPLEVIELAQEVLVLEAGRIVASGAPREIFASAATFGALHALGAENRYDARVLERTEATTTVETKGGCRLSMVRVPGFPDPERVAVRAEDVMLSAEAPGVVSAQNVFEGTVVELRPLGEQVSVELEAAGERWCVRVTPRATKSLGLEPGRRVHLLIKAHAILPV